MNIVAVGISCKTSPIEAREQFYLRTNEQELLLSELKNNPAVVEALVLSTCNRTEIYAHLIDRRPELLFETLLKIKKLPADTNLNNYFYRHFDDAAVRHFFRVSAGLESLILGEKQILGQIKEAVERSRHLGMMAKMFNILSNVAIRAGKKARTETEIGCGGSSVSWAAVHAAHQMLGTLEDKVALIIGAGKMGELALKYLRNKGAKQIYVMNRSCDKAESLAKEVGGEAVSFWEIEEILKKADLCICSAGACHYLVEKPLLEKVMSTRRNRKMVCIDISMPRNIDPKVTEIENVSFFAIDDLGQAIEDNAQKRLAAVCQVEEIVDRKVSEFYGKIAARPEARESVGACEFVTL